MSRYTKEDIFRIVEEEDVEFIRLQFTDIFGTLKNVAITSSQLEKALNNKCMFDGSSIEGFVRIEESDMYLYPDLDTFTIFPWRPQQGKVARIICDIYCADKTPFTGDSRYILKRQIEEAKNLGYTFNKKLKGKYEKDTESLMKSAGLDAKEASDWAYLVSEVVNWEWMLQVLKAAEWSGTHQEAVDIINAAVIVDESLKVTVGAEEKS